MKISIKNLEKNYNISEKNETTGALKLLLKFFGVLIGIYLLLLLIANYITYLIPLEKEIDYFGSMSLGEKNIEYTKKINEIIPNFKYKLTVIDGIDDNNAFAGLGGNIYITSELFESLEYKNELLFLIGHEQAHVENRDPIKIIVSKIPIKFILGMLFGTDMSQIFEGLTFVYSKKVELKADRLGLDFVNENSGNVSCALIFFEKNNDYFSNILEVVSDHPTTQSRINILQNYIKQKNYIEESCEKINIFDN